VKFLLDTCVLSELVKSQPDARVLRWFEASKAYQLWISTMTLAELQRGVNRLPESKRQLELALWLKNLEMGFEDRVLSFDSKAAKVWAEMTSQVQAYGKPMAAFDSIIAATARANACTLVTRNVKDFSSAGLELLNPWIHK